MSLAGSPVAAGLRPSRRLRVVHLCVGFTWNMSASALSSTPASRSASEPASASAAAAAPISARASASVAVAALSLRVLLLLSQCLSLLLRPSLLQRQFLGITAACCCD